MEAARLSGLPLSEQVEFASFIILQGSSFIWRDADPTPKDNKIIKNNELRQDQGINYWLSDFEKDELTQRQIYYQLNGGVLGSIREAFYNETIVVDLNIVYDPNLITYNTPQQTKLEYIQENLKPKLRYWTETLSKINLDYTVRYSIGTVDSGRKKITSGTIDGMANIFYFNDPKSLYAYAVTQPQSDHIFISELKDDFVYDRSLCHELAHLFGVYGITGIIFIDVFNLVLPVANIISDVQINLALGKLQNNEVRKGIDWIDDFRKAPRQVYYTPQLSKLGPNATRRVNQRQPTIYDIYRFGARILGEKKK